MGIIKTSGEIRGLRDVCKITSTILNNLILHTQVGDTGLDIDKRAKKLFEEVGVEPAFLGLYGFPASLCISVNEYIVHGIPDGRKFQEGDIIKYDIGGRLDGVCSDMARTFILGKAKSDAHVKLVDDTRRCLELAAAQVVAGNTLRDIARAIEEYAVANGYGNVDDFHGHGIGRNVHEPPPVHNSLRYATDIVIEVGMALAIEPMYTLGSGKVEVNAKNQWLIKSADNVMTAHFENVVLCTSDGPEILTR